MTEDFFSPFEPTDGNPWDRAKALHLARRAGFGATAAEAEALVALGPEGAVERFVGFAPEDSALEADLAARGGALVDFTVERDAGPLDPLRRWWLYRMVHGGQPLQEKLVLLWHDHFACQESKVVRQPMLLTQNKTFRALGGGPFRVLLGAVARDAAMLHYLDNRVSTKEAPNENWARELLELFALGVDHYSQQDVVELARIFTGWTTADQHGFRFEFDPALHDAGDKTLFGAPLAGRAGAAGIEEGDEALDRIVQRPECARFVATKLLGWFATHDLPTEPGVQPAIDALAEVLRAHDLDVRSALRVLFRSRWFHAPERRFAMLRNPVEYVVAAARAIGVQSADRAGLERATQRMGMHLLEPPSVGGWEHGAAWAGPGTAAARLEVALALSELPHAARRTVGRATIDLDGMLADEGGILAEASAERAAAPLVDALLARVCPDLLPDGALALDGARRAALLEFANGALARAPRELEPVKRRRVVVRAVLHVVLALPEVALA
jgi:uncharacterized protein (DUF1800 family)